MPNPYGGFNGIQFDWMDGSPQRFKRDTADWLSGQCFWYFQQDFHNMQALVAVIAVRPVGDGSLTVNIDSWKPLANIRYTLTMSNGREQHLAILTDIGFDRRMWRADPNNPGQSIVEGLVGRMEFLLLS